jgi:hypothetical protein
MRDAKKEHLEWLHGVRGNVLHRAKDSGLVVRYLPNGGRTYATAVTCGGKSVYTRCGRIMRLIAPGVLARLGMKRCSRCCQVSKLPEGHGTPNNGS